MNVEIIPIRDHEKYLVNGQVVFKDHFMNWSCKTDLTGKELQAFHLYETIVIKNSRIKTHTKASYRIIDLK